MRVIIGGVGYPDLRDHSAGLAVAERLMAEAIGPDVVVEDLSFNPIAVVQRLQDELPDAQFGRAVFVSAIARVGLRTPGAITAYRWDLGLPDAEEIHRAVCDAVTGVIHLDNTLIVCGHFGALPAEVFVVEIEPFEHEFGSELSVPVAAALGPAGAIVSRIATDPVYSASLQVAPLGGGRAVSVGAW